MIPFKQPRTACSIHPQPLIVRKKYPVNYVFTGYIKEAMFSIEGSAILAKKYPSCFFFWHDKNKISSRVMPA
jgi:hypothetical protein